MSRRPHGLLVLGLAAFSATSAAAQVEPSRLAVGFDYAGFAERPVELLAARSPLVQEATTPSGTFGNVLFSTAMLGAVGAVGGGFIGAGLNDTGDDLYSVIQGAVVGAWIGGGAGGAAASGRPVPAFLGSAVGVVAGLGLLDAGQAGLLLAPLTHGIVTALFTSLMAPRNNVP